MFGYGCQKTENLETFSNKFDVQILRKNVVINSRKYDQNIGRSWSADLVERKDSLLVFVGIFNETLTHPFLGVIRDGTISYEYYWLDRWFNVFRFHEPDGTFRNFYCNLNMPPVFQNGVLDYIDLDVDVIVWKDFRYEIFDLDDFKKNSDKYQYPEKLKRTVKIQLRNLIKLIQSREFPFNISIE